MGAKRRIYQPESKCGYIFLKKGGSKKRAFTPEPYSKVNSVGEEIVLTKEERKIWVDAYYQALEELGESLCSFSQKEEVYQKVEEILERTGSYRFL